MCHHRVMLLNNILRYLYTVLHSYIRIYKNLFLPNSSSASHYHREIVMHSCYADGDDVKRKKCRVKFPWRIEFKYGGHVGGCFSPDGELFATACGCTLVVFRAVDGRQIATYDGHTRVIRHVAYSSDGKHIVTCSDDKTVKVWNAPDKQVGAGLESPRSPALGHSPRRVSGISKPIPILSELYPVRSLSATGDDDAASPPRSPGVNRRLVRRSSLTELSPASYAKDEDGKVETDVYDQSLHHIHLRKIDDAVLKQ